MTLVPFQRLVRGQAGLGLAALSALFLGVLAWLWPIGAGGMMPVGGDVTQFFLGLMGTLSVALREGRLPVWNELWGYGFRVWERARWGFTTLPT